MTGFYWFITTSSVGHGGPARRTPSRARPTLSPFGNWSSVSPTRRRHHRQVELDSGARNTRLRVLGAREEFLGRVSNSEAAVRLGVMAARGGRPETREARHAAVPDLVQ